MSLEYEQNSMHSERRKSLQELKQMNQPNTELSISQTAPITPIVIQCPMADALPELTQRANDACWELQTLREYLPNLKSRTDLTAVQTSLTGIENSLTQMISLLEQDGSRNERRTCKWLNWLPDFDLLVVIKWIVLVLVLTTAVLAMVYGIATVVSNIRNLFP